MAEARSFVVIQEEVPTVAVDFDLTLVDNEWIPLPGAREAMQYLRQTGWQIIVWTAQPDVDPVRAVLEGNNIPFDSINENPRTDHVPYSRKIKFHATVDDKAIHFNGDWPDILSELDKRRKDLQLENNPNTKVRLLTLDGEGRPQTMAVFGLSNGKVVERTNSASPVICEILRDGIETADGIMFPRDGVEFLKALLEFQGTYLWSEIDK
jgi:hypothetical protein